MAERYGPHVLQALAVGDTVSVAWAPEPELAREIRAGLALASGVDDRRINPVASVVASVRDFGLDMLGPRIVVFDSKVERVRTSGDVVLANGQEFERRDLTIGGLLMRHDRARPAHEVPCYTGYHDYHAIAAKRLFYAAVTITLPPMDDATLAVLADMLDAAGGAEQAAFLRSLP